MSAFPDIAVIKRLISIIAVHTPSDGDRSFAHRMTHAFVLYTRGECEYIFPYRQFTVHNGCMIFLPEASDYRIAPIGDSNCLVLNFTCEALNGVPAFILEPSDPVALRTLFEKAFTVWLRREKSYLAACMSYAYAILAQTQRDFAAPPGLPNCVFRLNQAVAQIHSHYTEPEIHVSALAQAANMSERTFRSLFQASFHMPPVKYIMRLRMILADELITSQLFTISDVAEKCGYRDVYYFSRLFKTYYGVPPTQYAARVNQK